MPAVVSVRVPLASDASALHELFDDGEVMRYVGDGRVRDMHYYAEFVEQQAVTFRDGGYGLGTVIADGSVAGFAGIHRWDAPWGPTGELEMGWRLGRRFWGAGVAYRAGVAILEWAPPRELVAMIHSGNERSEALALRLGFVPREEYDAPGGVRARCFRRP